MSDEHTKELDQEPMGIPERIYVPISGAQLMAVSPELQNIEGAWYVLESSRASASVAAPQDDVGRRVTLVCDDYDKANGPSAYTAFVDKYGLDKFSLLDAIRSVVASSPASPSLTPEQPLVTENPFEQIVERSLLKAGYSYVTDHGGDSPARLDFYLPADDVHIEVKTMHSDRVAEQMSRVTNVIVAQGRAAIEWLAARISAAPPSTQPSARVAATLVDREEAAKMAFDAIKATLRPGWDYQYSVLQVAGMVAANIRRLSPASATVQPVEEQKVMLRSWLVCMRKPRPSDWEKIVEHLIEDTESMIG